MKDLNMEVFKKYFILFGCLLLSACVPAAMHGNESLISFPTVTATFLPIAISTTPAPSPTPDRFSAAALAFIPHTIDEIAQSVEVRSPIDDPEGYKEDMGRVLIVIHEQILPDYSGVLTNAGGGSVGVQFDGGVIVFSKTELNPIASVYYTWTNNQGDSYKIPIEFFPGRDSQGKFVYSMFIDPIFKMVNKNGYVDNPAPNWSIGALLKDFPMYITGRGSFEALTYFKGDEALKRFGDVYYRSGIGSEENGNKLVNCFWNILDEDGIFDRECEGLPILMKGGQ